MNPIETWKLLQTREKELLEELLVCVRIESPTSDKGAVDRFGEHMAARLLEIGMSIHWKKEPDRGNHLIGRWTGGKEGKKDILLIGHLDTVWKIGTLQTMPVRVEGDRAFGPGIFDMKGGIMIALQALRLIRENQLHTNLTIVLSSDEEEGSESSRSLIQELAGNARCAFVLEPAGPDNAVKTKRRGVGRFHVRVKGRAAHAGVDPAKGVNAIAELAHQVLQIQEWNGSRDGVSAHVGLIQGGTRTNVIPDLAEAIVDARCDTKDDVEWLESKFRSLQPKHPEASVSVSGGMERPPLERTESVLALYREAVEIGSTFNYSLNEYWTGGGSDGNLTAAMGVPTLDGLGVEGDGAHASHEHILIPSLSKRATLLYHLIRNRL